MSSALPERYQRYADPAGQVAPQVHSGPVELYGEADPIVHVPDPYNPSRSVEVRRSSVQPSARAEPRDLSPLPLIDPLAARMAGAGLGVGVAGAGVGWGLGQAAAGIALIGSGSGVAVLVLLILAARLTGAGRGRGGDTYNTEIHQSARLFGRINNSKG